MNDRPHAIVIGAGFTGCATAHDLALRGFQVTVLERGEIASGTSGRTHGLLHSGGRYCVNDPEAASECIQENLILRRIAKQCIEFNGGLFVALDDEDVAYAQAFSSGATSAGIPIEQLNPAQTLRIEPNLNPGLRLAFTVPDGTFDPLRLALAFAASARKNDSCFFPYHEVKEMIINGLGNVVGVRVWDRIQNTEYEARADIVVNATGAWAGHVASMAHGHVPVNPTPGIMVAFDRRIVERAINRLCPPGDGDILIPQRRMAVIGTTSFTVENADYIPIDPGQVQLMIDRACMLVPSIRHTRQRGVYMSARPLIGSSIQGRSLSRTFKCFDHQDMEGIGGLVTITGGKATTCRAMAEKTTDLVCQKLGINQPCATAEISLASYREFYS